MKDDYSNVREYYQMLGSLLATKAANRNCGPTTPLLPLLLLLLFVLLLLLLHLQYLILFLPLPLLLLLLPSIHKLLLRKVERLTSTDLNLNVANL
jgi:predicted MFS family arabinose efflux permease